MAACLRTGSLARLGLLSAVALVAVPRNARAQSPASAAQSPAPATATPPQGNDRPIPDIQSLMEQVEAQEKISQKTIHHYIYHVTSKQQDLDSHGAVTKTSTEERENFWVSGAFISRLLSRDGKPISGDDLKKQNEEIDKRIAAAKERAQEKEAGTAPPPKKGEEEVTFARFLELGQFSNPRRVEVNGRDTIAVDFSGDPKAKTRNLLEGAIHDVTGTVWIDEQDHAFVRIEGHFFDDFKIGGGLLADIHKGSSFRWEWAKVNDDAWLPTSFSGRGSARIALFFNHSGAIEQQTSDYRKFQATATVLPGITPVEPPSSPGAVAPAATPAP
jgi:hypothetical protein